MTPADLPIVIGPWLAANPTFTLATVDDHGSPHAALNLFWISHPDSAHSRHLAVRHRVAAVLYSPFTTPAEICGLQMHGVARVCLAADFDRLWPAYLARHPYARAMESRARSERFYCFTPDWIRWIDNSVRFGFKIESPWPVTG
jgi:uncharacterized protein YhbP (UPF0306 family)